jgi:hypothetical protein
MVEPTAWIFHTSDDGDTVKEALCFSRVSLEELSILHRDTVLDEFPYHRKYPFEPLSRTAIPGPYWVPELFGRLA